MLAVFHAVDFLVSGSWYCFQCVCLSVCMCVRMFINRRKFLDTCLVMWTTIEVVANILTGVYTFVCSAESAKSRQHDGVRAGIQWRQSQKWTQSTFDFVVVDIVAKVEHVQLGLFCQKCVIFVAQMSNVLSTLSLVCTGPYIRWRYVITAVVMISLPMLWCFQFYLLLMCFR